VNGSAQQCRPNVVMIMCDQLQLEALHCYGNRHIATPNIDRLAREGIRAEHFFVQSPVCQPSRASYATGRYPHAHQVKYNWYDLPDREVTLQGHLSRAGYRTAAVGKMHFEPTEQLHGFDERVFVEGKMFTGDDEYRLFLDRLGKRQLHADHIARWGNDENFGTDPSPVPLEEYIDYFIANKACDLLKRLSDDPQPYFAWVSFVNPHLPFDPPPPYDTMYDPLAIPLPEDWEFRQDRRIPEHRLASAGKDFSHLTESALRRVRAAYYGQVTLIDDCVGRILTTLEASGDLDNTVVLFTTDHGEMLGHRGLLWKGGRMMYDALLRVPFIVRYPQAFASGRVVSDLCESIDVLPTILDLLDVPVPDGVQGVSLRPVLRQEKVPSWRREVFSESMEVKMIRDHTWKLIFYPGQLYGEMYNVADDPLEVRNLYHLPEYREIRGDLLQRLVARLALSEDPLPKPTQRPGYFEASGFHPASEVQ
jgi:arylsulfatase